MRIVLSVLALALVTGLASHPESKMPVWPCSWTQGRMTAGSGTPSIRIWPRGTHRLLGVVNLEHPVADDAFDPTVPNNIANLLIQRNHFTVWGDFYVCPVTPER